MAAAELPNLDIERGVLNHRHSTAGSHETEGSLYFSDVEEGSTYSHFYSTVGDDYCLSCVSDTEITGGATSCLQSRRVSSALEVANGVSVPEIKVHLAKVERDCRICHLSLEDGGNSESGVAIELGCSCKDDLAVAHKICAEAWFNIKGNKTCEICNSVARNVVGIHDAQLTVQLNDSSNTLAAATESSAAVPASSEPRRFWQGQRFLNFLLACMVFAFVISWLFHFNVPS